MFKLQRGMILSQKMKLVKNIERYAFGICSVLGDKFGIRASTIRLYFIYVSFFTFGSPVVLYLAIAFWLNIKHYMVARKHTLWDL
jgi:phage shock protein PspC (stress-responsive transcriptional regulator)